PLPPRWLGSSRLLAAAVLLLVPGPVSPTRPDPAPWPKKPLSLIAERVVIIPAAPVEEGHPVEVADTLGDVERQRNAVGYNILQAQAELEALDSRLEKQKATAASSALSSAVEADEEVRDLRTRIAKANAVLDDYRSRGNDLGRPTPRATARIVAE